MAEVKPIMMMTGFLSSGVAEMFWREDNDTVKVRDGG